MAREEFWTTSTEFTTRSPVTAARVRKAEASLGYRLPRSYVDLLETRNGGTPRRDCFPTKVATSWADDHVKISGIAGLGGARGIDGALGSRYLIGEWGYPDTGIVVGHCPSAGHDVVMLDYSRCGPKGEPRVVHVETECEDPPRVTVLARDFAAFLRGLVSSERFDQAEEEEVLEGARARVERGAFSSSLEQACAASGLPDVRATLRALAGRIVDQKRHFSLHDDALSVLMYDLLFWLHSSAKEVPTPERYLQDYPQLVVFGGTFSTGGYAPGFVQDWLRERLASKDIVRRRSVKGSGRRLACSKAFVATIEDRLAALEASAPTRRTKRKRTR